MCEHIKGWRRTECKEMSYNYLGIIISLVIQSIPARANTMLQAQHDGIIPRHGANYVCSKNGL